MKRYLIKIFEKLQDNQSSLYNNDLSDPLTEHSNSVQEHILKRDNQSSLSDINNQSLSKNRRDKGGSFVNGRNISGNRKPLQFYTSNNFYPASQIQKPSSKQKMRDFQMSNNLRSKTKNYENTENLIKEESSDDDKQTNKDQNDDNDYKNRQNLGNGGNNNTLLNSKGQNIRRKIQKTHAFENQISPDSNPKNIYQNQVIGNSYLDRARLSKVKQQENSYNDIFDRSATNRTPLFEHYQNQNSLTRNNQTIINNNNSTSVPRPTIANELRLLKKTQCSPIDSKNRVQNQFLHNNNLANFMWHQDNSNVKCEQENTSTRDSKTRKEYNIHDGSSAIRPITRSNQRRPISRQVNAVDNQGVSAQKIRVQQQMRNTHFGDGGFGFGSKLKADQSLDSERKVSRKRSANRNHLQDFRESFQANQNGNAVCQKIQNVNQMTNQYLNRSINIHNKNHNALQSYNEQVSTQDSSGSHFYQHSSFLNKSIESNSSRTILIQAKNQALPTFQQINETINDNSVKNQKIIKNDFVYDNSRVSRNILNQNQTFSQERKAINLNESPNLNLIEEFVYKKENGKTVIGQSCTSSKFYVAQPSIPLQKVNKQLPKGQEEILVQIQQNQSDISQDRNLSTLNKPYNTKQEKFFPLNKSSLKYDKNQVGKNECIISSEFLKGQQQNKHDPLVGNNTKSIKQKGNEMIREEQYEEISEDESPKNQDQDHKHAYNDISESFSISTQAYLQMQNIERPSINKITGSRPHHQTKENQSFDDYNRNNNSQQNNHNSLSVPRNYQQKHYDNSNIDQSSKTTSSVASLTTSKQNLNYGNSISPKPFKWNNKDISFNQQNNSNNNANNSQKIQEIQKEVNLMYLGQFH